MDRRRGRLPEAPELETLKGTAEGQTSVPHRSAADERERIEGKGGGIRGGRLTWRGREERADRPRARAREASVMSAAAAPCAWEGGGAGPSGSKRGEEGGSRRGRATRDAF